VMRTKPVPLRIWVLLMNGDWLDLLAALKGDQNFGNSGLRHKNKAVVFPACPCNWTPYKASYVMSKTKVLSTCAGLRNCMLTALVMALKIRLSWQRPRQPKTSTKLHTMGHLASQRSGLCGAFLW